MPDPYTDLMRFKANSTWKMVSDPIYGYVYFNKEVEEPLINHIVVQRLRYILQLQTAHLVYPGAVHSRFQHSMGVMHLAGLMAEDFVSKLVAHYGPEALDGYSAASLVEAARLSGLLHDAGHVAFGHAFERAILWEGDVPGEVNNHEKIGAKLYDIVLYDIVKGLEDKHNLPALSELIKEILRPDEPRNIIRMIRWIVKDSLYPADVLDFLRRDSYYAGTNEYGYIMYERLYKHTYPYMHSAGLVLLLDRVAMGVFKQYLAAKSNMYEHVYYHGALRAFDRVLHDLLKLLNARYNYVERIEKLLEGEYRGFAELTDTLVYADMMREALYGSGEISRLSRSLLVERKPLWKRIGREYVISAHWGPEFLESILKIIYSKQYRESVRSAVNEGVSSALSRHGVSGAETWIDILDLSPVPKSLLFGEYERQPLSLYVGKKAGKELVFDQEINLVEEGLPLYIIFRAYIQRENYSPELEPVVTSALAESVESCLGIKRREYSKGIMDILKSMSAEDLSKYKLTM